ncbi:MAG: efflux RND transporter periplasmic adaptor subunit [Bacteroidales bacterium]|nr:efflux RND transporter periplasmic adaptor subunit [Candidatus Latescibacterota bacterium]
MASKKKKWILIVSALVVISVLVVVAVGRKNGGEKLSVETQVTSLHDLVETVTATGRIEPRTQVKISADVAGKITHLGIKEGDWVEKGDLLVRLDQERYSAALEQAEASLRSVKANANLAKETLLKVEKDYERTSSLVEQNLESRASYDQAFTAVQVEKARHQSMQELVAQSLATVKQARDNLSKTTIYAPMAGTISTLNKEVGEIALGSQFQEDVIMIVSNLSEMEALVNIDENDIVNVSMGDSSSIEIDALPDRVFRGVVREIASSANISRSGTTDQKTEFEVKLSIIDAATQLRPGMTASTDIVIETRNSTLAVPLQCVTVRTPEQLKRHIPVAPGDAVADSLPENEYEADKDGFVTVVWVVKDGVATAIQVVTGIQSETHIEILSGISEGDMIVTGNYRAISQTLKNDLDVIAEEKKEEE